ncbi:MAG: hypothetical protein NTV51_05565 [Verrucomicrobia bacterium]|nr:hypothetical protein [Verrucomicrobiota bacterium]
MKFLLYVVGLIVAGASSLQAAAADEWTTVDAVGWADRLVILKADGMFAIWRVAGDALTPQSPDELTLSGARHLATDGSRLWTATTTGVFHRDRGGRQWMPVGSLPKSEAASLALVVVDRVPLVVYPTYVRDAVQGKDFPVPVAEGQVRTNALRLQAAYADRTMAWFGTGEGEWGGTLYGLHPATGNWVQYSDAAHYVTGIAGVEGEPVSVAWSMSHFMARTLLRTHAPTAKIAHEWPELAGRYFQRIAYSPHDRRLYGIENERLVRIEQGRPQEIVPLPGRLFSAETDAIGVAPGVRAVIPLSTRLLVVVPNVGVPLRVDLTARKLRRLSTLP